MRSKSQKGVCLMGKEITDAVKKQNMKTVELKTKKTADT